MGGCNWPGLLDALVLRSWLAYRHHLILDRAMATLQVMTPYILEASVCHSLALTTTRPGAVLQAKKGRT